MIPKATAKGRTAALLLAAIFASPLAASVPQSDIDQAFSQAIEAAIAARPEPWLRLPPVGLKHPCASPEAPCVLGYPLDLTAERAAEVSKSRVWAIDLVRDAQLQRNQWFRSKSVVGSTKARFYDPTVGIFLSQDPAPDDFSNPPSLHKYLYPANLTPYEERPLSRAISVLTTRT